MVVHRWVDILLLDQARVVCLFSVGQYLNCKHPILVKEVFRKYLRSWEGDVQVLCLPSFTFELKFGVSIVQSLSCVQLFANPWTVARQASLSFTISQSLLKLMSIESVMPFNHLFLFIPFSSCFQSFPAGFFLMSQFFASGGQSTGTLASASVLPINIQD